VVGINIVRHVALGELGGFETMASCLDFSDLNHIARLAAIAGMLTRLPLTLTWPWLTNWRAAKIVGTNLAR
jgi:hypothetical protein